jgi:hypothetical protein
VFGFCQGTLPGSICTRHHQLTSFKFNAFSQMSLTLAPGLLEWHAIMSPLPPPRTSSTQYWAIPTQPCVIRVILTMKRGPDGQYLLTLAAVTISLPLTAQICPCYILWAMWTQPGFMIQGNLLIHGDHDILNDPVKTFWLL